MTPARLAGRLAALETQLARLRPEGPSAPFQWLGWATLDELVDLERLAEAEQVEGRELTAVERLRAIEIEAAATRRMPAGGPPA